MADYIKIQLTDELREQTSEIVEKTAKKGKIKAGINEVTKAIERGTAKLVVIAEDVSPKEVVMHLPVLCGEKQVPFSYIATRKALGEKAGLRTATASIAIIETEVEADLKDLTKKLHELRK
ncbi:MAG: 50S ribosomal protein L7Ae [Candidatus Diapherotrites archaeon]|nr:50S ribosomal protein L7Ae [Candidatus Diapherotrites archaeon]